MNHQRWIQLLLITFLLCCAAPLSVADNAPATQKQRVTEHQTAEPFTIAVLPDTQFYCDCRHKLSAKWGNGDLRHYFFAQTEWVRDNQKRLNIAFLVHEGDIVQADAPEEWAIAKEAIPNQHWVRGAYYAGLMAMYESTLDRAYLDDCMKWGKQVSWRIKEQGGGPYESGAYPLVCGQIWYGCYRAKKDELMMQPTLAFLENPKVENPVSAPGKWYLENTGHRFVDGLFTAPPMLAMLYQMTGDEKYVDWMNACFWDVHKEIFDHDAGLFYRDARSKPRKTKNGKKVLWSRGNGWAFGGLTRILKVLPDEHSSYPKYKSLYMEMAESLAKRQQADGFWRSSLDDPEQYTMKESSGTGFFCYGIAWGIKGGTVKSTAGRMTGLTD